MISVEVVHDKTSAVAIRHEQDSGSEVGMRYWKERKQAGDDGMKRDLLYRY